jgi:hypothetical protein
VALRPLICAGAIVAAVAGAVSCAQIIGLEPFGSGGGGGAGGAGATGGGPSSSRGSGGTASGAGGQGGATSTSTASGNPCAVCFHPPTGWLGPGVVEESLGCSGGETLLVSANVPSDTACGGCNCAAQGTCEMDVREDTMGLGTCSGNTPIVGHTNCTGFQNTVVNELIEFDPTTHVGTCAPQGACTPLPVSFSVCATGSSPCQQGGTCLAEGEKACVYSAKSGCPKGYHDAKVGYADYIPSCSCNGTPTGTKCDVTGSVTTYELPGCTGMNTTVVMTGVCKSVPDRQSVGYNPNLGSCAMPVVSGSMNKKVHVCCQD